jgi:hypothetical protein
VHERERTAHGSFASVEGSHPLHIESIVCRVEIIAADRSLFD